MVRHTAKARFQSINSAPCGGHTDRPAPVCTDGQRTDPGCYRRCSATARAARTMIEVPWIARDTAERTIGNRLMAVLRQSRLAEDCGAGFPQPSHARTVG